MCICFMYKYIGTRHSCNYLPFSICFVHLYSRHFERISFFLWILLWYIICILLYCTICISGTHIHTNTIAFCVFNGSLYTKIFNTYIIHIYHFAQINRYFIVVLNHFTVELKISVNGKWKTKNQLLEIK